MPGVEMTWAKMSWSLKSRALQAIIQCSAMGNRLGAFDGNRSASDRTPSSSSCSMHPMMEDTMVLCRGKPSYTIRYPPIYVLILRSLRREI